MLAKKNWGEGSCPFRFIHDLWEGRKKEEFQGFCNSKKDYDESSSTIDYYELIALLSYFFFSS